VPGRLSRNVAACSDEAIVTECAPAQTDSGAGTKNTDGDSLDGDGIDGDSGPCDVVAND
jgi:hypothetical protein